MNSQTLKPSYSSMVLRPILNLFLVTVPLILALVGLLGLIGSRVAVPTTVVAGFLASIALILAGGIFLFRHVRYNKTTYELSGDRLRVQTGSPFSDNDTELLWSKVVQLNLRAGPIQTWLFGSGTISLEAAGQAGTEIRFRDVSDPDDVFHDVLSGYDRDADFSEQAVRETHRQAGSGIGLDFALQIGLIILPLVAVGFFLSRNFPLTPVQNGLIQLTLIVPPTLLFLYFLGVKTNTVYRIYEDYALRDVQFFGRSRQIVPLSVLSDVNVSVPVHKRLLGLSSLILSVPGLGDNVTLNNIGNGETLRSSLQTRSDELKDRETISGDQQRFEAYPHFASTMTIPMLILALGLGFSAGLYFLLEAIEALQRSPFIRLLVVGLPAGVAGLVFLVPFIRYTASSFAVEGNRVEKTFSFINRSITSLSTDKIKGIVKQQGILQRVFGTYSIIFHSIGTETNVSFFSIPGTRENEQLLHHIREKEGSLGGESRFVLAPDLTFNGLLFQHPILSLAFPLTLLICTTAVMVLNPIGSSLFGGFLVLGFLVWLVLMGYLNFYYKNCVALELFDDYLLYREGFFETRESYVTYEDIRNVRYAREPLSADGWITIDYAGATASLPNQQQGGGNTTGGSSVTFRHLSTVEAMAPALEDLFAGKIKPSELERRKNELAERTESVLDTTRPQTVPYVGQGVFYGLVVLLVFGDALKHVDLSTVGLTAIVLSIIGGTIGGIYQRTIFYSIKENQIESSHWIIFTRTKSIQFDNIDNIEVDRNIFDKILGTGTVKISTTGGSGVELAARFIGDYESFYERLQSEYNESRSGREV